MAGFALAVDPLTDAATTFTDLSGRLCLAGVFGSGCVAKW